MWVGKNSVGDCFWRRWMKGRGEGHFKVHLLYIQILFLPSVKHFGFDKFTLDELTQKELWLRVSIQIDPTFQQCQKNRLTAWNTDYFMDVCRIWLYIYEATCFSDQKYQELLYTKYKLYFEIIWEILYFSFYHVYIKFIRLSSDCLN